jgi:hypothetical protein
MGASGLRRRLRAQYWGLTKISSASRWISPLTVWVSSGDTFWSVPVENMKARKRAEKSRHAVMVCTICEGGVCGSCPAYAGRSCPCCDGASTCCDSHPGDRPVCCRRPTRRSRRGLRSNRRRSRDLQSRSPTVLRPDPTNELSNRKIRRADAQMVYWKGKQRRIIEQLRRLGKHKFHLERVSSTGNIYYVPHRRFVALRGQWRALGKALSSASKWVRPFRNSWTYLLHSEFSYGPGEDRPRIINPRLFYDVIQEFMEHCSYLEIKPNNKIWHAYLSLHEEQHSRPAKTRGKNRHVVTKVNHSKGHPRVSPERKRKVSSSRR